MKINNDSAVTQTQASTRVGTLATLAQLAEPLKTTGSPSQ